MILERRFGAALDVCPLVAIIRGVKPDEAGSIGQVLIDAGFRIIEVPLNSPDPFRSIELLAARFGDRAIIGGGTVLTVEDVARVRNAGGQIIVSPSINVGVIEATVAAGMISAPGYFTPSEAFAAAEGGAHALKLFPGEGAPPAVVKAHKAVLPPELPLLVVGGVGPDTIADYLTAGANGFGLGSGLYRPGQSPDQVASQAKAYISALEKYRRG